MKRFDEKVLRARYILAIESIRNANKARERERTIVKYGGKSDDPNYWTNAAIFWMNECSALRKAITSAA